jgi:two-component system phosphate regulon sensor histidine kinase PhoR
VPLPYVIVLIVATSIGVIATIMTTARRRRIQWSEPVREIERGARAIAQGAVSHRINAGDHAADDVRAAATAVNMLADRAKRDLEDMARLERVRQEFIGNVSHELRTPIFSVQGYLETLLDGALEDEKVSRQFVEKAYFNAQRLNTLLSDLIDITRIESGELRMSFRYVSIGDVFRDVVAATEMRATTERISIVIADVPADLMVYADKERLSQALTNLVDNAIKYNREGGSVTISAVQHGTHVEISVSDTGIGIPQEDITRIFERFYRVDKDRSRQVGGTGLGLAIVKHILEAHATTPHVTSVVSAGTTITFTLKCE